MSMTLVSGGIRLMRIFAEVPRERGRQTPVGLSKRAIFSVFDGYFFEYFRNEDNVIICNMQSVVGFSVIPKCMTLNDLDRLFRVKFCFRAGLAGWDRATSKNNCVKTNKDRHILSTVQIFARDSTLCLRKNDTRKKRH